MKINKIVFPRHMERSVGFTIPENGSFYVVGHDNLAFYDLDSGEVTELNGKLDLDSNHQSFTLNNLEFRFIGLWKGVPLLDKPGLGKLRLKDSEVEILYENGSTQKWSFENFSGDWEYVTFDKHRNAFLFGTPYDFDYRYVQLD